MVKRERKILTHVLLTVICVAVLFPIVWVVSTSLRRDNAAFSTKLFSTRLTLQNYIDLLFPEKNGPRLVSDLDALVLMAPPYDRKSVDEAVKVFAANVDRFKRYIAETETLKKRVDASIDSLKRYMEENTNSLVARFNGDIDRIIAELKFQRPEMYLAVAAYELGNLGVDLEGLEGVPSPSEGASEWRKMLGLRKEKYDALMTEVDEITNVFSELEAQHAKAYGNYATTKKLVESIIVPQMSGFINALKSALVLLQRADESRIEVHSVPDDSEVIEKFRALVDEFAGLELKSERYEDLAGVVQTFRTFKETFEDVLSVWTSFENRGSALFTDFLNLIQNFIVRAAASISEMVGLLRELDETASEVLSIQERLNELRDVKQRKLGELKRLQQEINKAYEDIKPAMTYIYAQILKRDLEKVKRTVSGLRLPDQLQMFNLQARRVFSLVTEFASKLPDGSREQRHIRNVLRNVDWPSIMRDVIVNYELFGQNYATFIQELKLYLSEVEKQGPSLMPTSKTGLKVRPVSLERLIDTVLSTYRNNVVPSMNVMAKKASDLSDKLNVAELRRPLRVIDASTFRIDQIWQRKPDHYLLNWIANSVLVSLSVAVIITAVTALAAYPFSRMRFRGRKYGIMSLLLIQMFPAIMYMIAIYTFLSFAGKYIPGFGLNKLSGLIFAYLGGIAYNMYLIKGYYDTIPDSLEEAAMIDGATRWQTFVRIVLPLASPILAVVVILTFMGTFNEFVLARIILQDVQQYTYAIGLYTFSTGPFETQWGLFTAAALIGMVPMVILFLLMQKYIVGGLVKGAVKG